MTCERVLRLAAGLAALPPRDPARVRAWAHSAGCPRCAAALREGERLVAMLEAFPPKRVPAGDLRRAAAPVLAELPPVRPRVLLPAATFLAAVVVAACARAPSGATRDWAAAVALAGVAVALAFLAERGLAAAAGAIAAALAFALSGGVGPLDLAEGVKCVATELAAAAVPLLAAVALSRRGAAGGVGVLAAAAAAGALAGMAALEIGCHAVGAHTHLLVFHAGGVLAAAGLGALAGAWSAPVDRALRVR